MAYQLPTKTYEDCVSEGVCVRWAPALSKPCSANLSREFLPWDTSALTKFCSMLNVTIYHSFHRGIVSSDFAST